MEGAKELEVRYQRCMKVSESTTTCSTTDKTLSFCVTNSIELELMYFDITGWSLVTGLVMKIRV